MKNKWQIGVTMSRHHMVTLEADTAEEACEGAINSCKSDSDYFVTGGSTIVSSCLINDSNTKGFAPYIPDFVGKKNGS